MKQRRFKTISMVMVSLLIMLLWPGVLMAMPITPGLEPGQPQMSADLTLTADKSEASPEDTVNLTVGFNLLPGAVSGYSATQISVMLPVGLEYVSSVAYIGGAPVVLTTVPVGTPSGTIVNAQFDNNTMAAGAAQLRINAKVGSNLNVDWLDVRAELFLQPQGGDMPYSANESAYFTLRINEPAPITPQVVIVTFNTNGGIRIGGGELMQTIPVGGAAYAPEVMRHGYTFQGWDTSFSNVYYNIEVTALWQRVVEPPTPVTPQVSRVQFNLNGGVRVGGGPLLQSVPVGGSAIEPYVFREGYIFLGWDVPFYNIRRDTAVTAQWTAETDTGMIEIEPPTETVVAGYFVNDRSNFTLFSHLPLIFYAERHVSQFIDVAVDGYALTAGTHFVATTGTVPGTTAIHFKASYLNTLSAGTHLVRVNFKDDVHANSQFTVAVYENVFLDVTVNDWFYKGVEAMNASELIRGVTSTSFDPHSQMTRGMVVTLLYRFTGEPSIDGFSNPFPDVAAGQYYTNAVMWASANGIVTGHDTGLFAPNDLMTREQFAAVLYRYQNALGSTTLDILMDRTYSDFNDIGSFANSAVTKLTMQGVFRDWPYDTQNRFQPKAYVSRAEVATVMRLWIESIGW